MHRRYNFCALMFLVATLFCLAPSCLRADEGLPQSVRTLLHTPLRIVGTSTYRKFGFSIYHVTLWAVDKRWDAAKPYALQLSYVHSVSKDTLVDTVMDDIRDQAVADEPTLTRWEGILNASMPSLEDGDTIVALVIPGKKSQLFYNGSKILSIDERAFSDAFINIWLGEKANQDMREKLLGDTTQ